MEPKNITTNLPIAAWDIIINALGQRSYAEVAGIIDLIRPQIRDQIDQPPANTHNGEQTSAKTS